MTALAQLDILSGAPLEPSVAVRRTPVRAHMRRVQGPPPLSGVERRDAALSKHEADATKRIALDYVRARLIALYQLRLATNTNATVNADDADQVIREWAECPAEVRALPSQNWRGRLFHARGWKKAGDTPSTRPHMHATPIACWRYVDTPAPTRERRALARPTAEAR